MISTLFTDSQKYLQQKLQEIRTLSLCTFTDNPPHLKVHAYRAAMQHVIMQMKPEFKTGDIRLVIKAGAELSFFEYGYFSFCC